MAQARIIKQCKSWKVARLREGTLKVRGFQKVSFTKANKMLSTKLPLMYIVQSGSILRTIFRSFFGEVTNTLQKVYFEIFWPLRAGESSHDFHESFPPKV